MVNADTTENSILTPQDLPAILVGGPPHAGKSVLTYNLTRELRNREIPHYVLRASTDVEGDWFSEGDFNTVLEIRRNVRDNESYARYNQIFVDLVCHDLPRRYMPFIVDVGGKPTDNDTCIFQNCTHSILLLIDKLVEDTKTWHHYTQLNKNLTSIAELQSLLPPGSFLTSKPNDPILRGTITNLDRKVRVPNLKGDEVFDALIERVSALFSSPKISGGKLEQWHQSLAQGPVADLTHELHKRYSTRDEWVSDMLEPLVEELPSQNAMWVYGRAPNWLYGALTLHTRNQPFHLFDARLGWVKPPTLQTGASQQVPQDTLDVQVKTHNDSLVMFMHPKYHYLDYDKADQLVFPELPSNHGLIITGKLPLWLFTALARLYAQRDVPWIALNDARTNQPVVIYSRVANRTIGDILPPLPKR